MSWDPIDRSKLSGTGVSNAHAKGLLDQIDKLNAAAEEAASAIYPPVEDLAGLKAIPAARLQDRMQVLCEESGTYRFDAQSEAAADEPRVVIPTAVGTGVGRFIKTTMLQVAHGDRHATGGVDPITPGSIGAADEGHDHDDTYAPLAAAEGLAHYLRNNVSYGGLVEDDGSSITPGDPGSHEFKGTLGAAEYILAGVRYQDAGGMDTFSAAGDDEKLAATGDGLIVAVVLTASGYAYHIGSVANPPESPSDLQLDGNWGEGGYLRVADFQVIRTDDPAPGDIEVTVIDRRPVMGEL